MIEVSIVGGVEADHRMDVVRSPASETGTSEEESVDEEILLGSPSQEQEIEIGTAPSCLAETSTTAVGPKWT